nr:MAG: hypothetical protein EDM05_23425 [Leptolyngbya sp. IPPAS B-1204]
MLRWLTVFLISLIVVITPGRVCSEFWVNPAFDFVLLSPANAFVIAPHCWKNLLNCRSRKLSGS